MKIVVFRERGHRMQGFTHFCKNTSRRLGRELEQREVDFLLWVYDRHQKGNQQIQAEHKQYIQE